MRTSSYMVWKLVSLWVSKLTSIDITEKAETAVFVGINRTTLMFQDSVSIN